MAWFDNCLRILEPVHCAVSVKLEALAMLTGAVSLVARSEKTPPSSSLAGVALETLPHLAAAFGQPAGPAPEGDLFERVLRVLLPGCSTRHRPASVPPDGRGTRLSDEAEPDEAYEVVVIVAVSAGALLAARLTEPGRLTILLLEAGGADNDTSLHVPAAFSRSSDLGTTDLRHRGPGPPEPPHGLLPRW